MIKQILSAWRYFQLSNITKKNKINRRYLVLSFDCDQRADANAAVIVGNWLSKNRQSAVFAVPGTEIENNFKVYQHVAKLGFEFINHGYQAHFSNGKPSCWYDQITQDKIFEDIKLGDRVLKKLLKQSPLGFRAPHFGLFQNDNQLNMLYSLLIKQKYIYASTTIPKKALIAGSLYKTQNGLWEFPLSGTFDNPETILDSWSFLASPDKIYEETQFFIQFRKMIKFFSCFNLPVILSFYCDPSHIVNKPEYFRLVLEAKSLGYIITDYRTILKNV